MNDKEINNFEDVNNDIVPNSKNDISATKKFNEKSFLMDVNIIQAPIFTFQNKSFLTVSELLSSDTVSKEVKSILEKVPDRSRESQLVEIVSWTDSKGMKRELLAMSTFKLPNGFSMDVVYGLIGLYIKKNSPILFSNSSNKYIMPKNELEFTVYELCEFMNLTICGKNYERIKTEIMKLKAVDYYSLGKGVFYNKEKEKYHISTKEATSLITYFKETNREMGNTKTEKCKVIFGEMIMSNIENSFIRFLNKNTFFKLPSGVTRKVYTYIEGNKGTFEGKDFRYIKRSFDVIASRIPLEYKYTSDLKRRLRSANETLVKNNVIIDYFYGDEILINGIKEKCIYWILKGTKEEVITSLTKKEVEPKVISEDKEDPKEELIFPENIRQEILNFGVSEKKVDEILPNFTKYQLAEYILWLKDGVKRGKVKDKAAMFVFAIDTGAVKVNISNPEIHTFVDKYKKEVEGKLDISENIIQEAYKEYIDIEMQKFKDEEEFMHDSIRDTLLSDLSEQSNKNIKVFKTAMNFATSDSDKQSSLKLLTKWEDFTRQKEDSELFMEHFIKNVSLYKKLKDYSQFKNEYISENQ